MKCMHAIMMMMMNWGKGGGRWDDDGTMGADVGDLSLRDES